MKASLDQIRREEEKGHEMAATIAQRYIDGSTLIQGNLRPHPYLQRKKCDAYGLREYKGSLIIPAYDINGKLWTVQFISKDGNAFLEEERKKAAFLPSAHLMTQRKFSFARDTRQARQFTNVQTKNLLLSLLMPMD